MIIEAQGYVEGNFSGYTEELFPKVRRTMFSKSTVTHHSLTPHQISTTALTRHRH
eukprot:m.463025 g.463025  ORF g.463025 m.463025 type:complete len:55 (-) comp21608_c0_seq1:87-251(-)